MVLREGGAKNWGDSLLLELMLGDIRFSKNTDLTCFLRQMEEATDVATRVPGMGMNKSEMK